MFKWKVKVGAEVFDVRLPRAVVSGEPFLVEVGGRSVLVSYHYSARSLRISGQEASGQCDSQTMIFQKVVTLRRQSISRLDGEPDVDLNLEIGTVPGTLLRAAIQPLIPGGERRGGQKGDRLQRIRSPITGKVLKVLVEKGSKVEAQAPLLIIEAMKMENKVFAPSGGVVTAVKIREGDAVTAGCELLILGTE
jgi:biotin carboxyl carrier protein